MAFCFTRTKARALCWQMGYSPMRGKSSRPPRFAPAPTLSRARGTSCSALRRRALFSAAPRRLPPAPLIRLCARFAPASSRSRRSRPPCAFMWPAPIRHIGRSRCSTCFPARRFRSSVRPSAYTTACCANFASFSARTRWSCRLSRAPLPPAAGRCRLSSSQPFALPSAPSMGAYPPMA